LQSCTAVKCAGSGRVAPVTGVLTFPAGAPLLGSGATTHLDARPRKPKKVATRLLSSCPSPSAVSIGARRCCAGRRARNSDDFALLVAVASLDDAVPSISFPLVLPLRPAGPRPPRSTRSGAFARLPRVRDRARQGRSGAAGSSAADEPGPKGDARVLAVRASHSDGELTGIPVL